MKKLEILEFEKPIIQLETKIKELESRADKIHRSEIKRISREQDVIAIHSSESSAIADILNLFRRQEIIEIMEQAFDECQDVANFLEALKYELD